jgi:hypothetical protein
MEGYIQVVKILKIIKRIPDMPLGVSKLSYRIEDLNVEVYYEYAENDKVVFSGRIKFDFYVALSIESENNAYSGPDSSLPPEPFVLYEFAPSKREGFRGFKIWFEDGEVITVSCKSVLIGNEIL